MIMPENLNKNLEQKSYTECVHHENYLSAFPAHPSPLYPGPEPPPPSPQNQVWVLCQNSLTRELKIRVVGFVLKKLLTHVEMLIVPHALHCVDSCIFVFYLIGHSLAYCFGFQCHPPPPLFPQVFFIRFSFSVKIHLLESSQLEL